MAKVRLLQRKMEELAEHIRTADGFMVVAGEYNHSIQPGLSNLMDHYLEEFLYIFGDNFHSFFQYWKPNAILSHPLKETCVKL
ncbi:NADPH-dependent FMN reductase [Nostoc sp.]|uniref:NADPH-dependent FMN reductase n=1 Tax=Nostoc sp. TaxID=1180 RepID=UPI002FF7F548